MPVLSRGRSNAALLVAMSWGPKKRYKLKSQPSNLMRHMYGSAVLATWNALPLVAVASIAMSGKRHRLVSMFFGSQKYDLGLAKIFSSTGLARLL